MKLIFLGLSLSSSWGNGHATTYRALLRPLAARHDILFLERSQPWYAENCDLPHPDFCTLRFYRDREELAAYAPQLAAADAVVLGSYVPEGRLLAEMLRPIVTGAFCFYDIDTPVTLAGLDTEAIPYIDSATIPLFDIYFSFTGGPTLKKLEAVYGARRALPLYCSADERRYRPMPAAKRWDLGYLGTYSPDRQPALERLLLEPARRAPDRKFAVAGSMYPADIAWPANVERIDHLPPDAHAEFFSGQAWTLNITRADMVAAGYSPSVRLFEASACGVPILSDRWTGIEQFFTPGREILLAENANDVSAALALPQSRREAIAAAARRRCLAAHTASHRAAEFEAALAPLPAT